MKPSAFLAVANLVFALSGCAGLDGTLDAMNRRQITSCVTWQGSIRTPGGHVGVTGITATGGANIDTCIGISP